MPIVYRRRNYRTADGNPQQEGHGTQTVPLLHSRTVLLPKKVNPHRLTDYQRVLTGTDLGLDKYEIM
jgi:hypothetical protein